MWEEKDRYEICSRYVRYVGGEKNRITWLMYSSPANSLLPLTTSRTNSGNLNWKGAVLSDVLWNFFQTLEKLNFVYILDHKCINLDLSKMTSCLCVVGSKPFTYLY